MHLWCCVADLPSWFSAGLKPTEPRGQAELQRTTEWGEKKNSLGKLASHIYQRVTDGLKKSKATGDGLHLKLSAV